MIEHLLYPLVSERFANDAQYREGHLRVINALPERRVLGLHTPDMKLLARQISRDGCEVLLNDGVRHRCANGAEVIRSFEQMPCSALCYEESVVWGFLINLEACTLEQRLSMLERYAPAMDNWAVCDAYCANAKWVARADREVVWAFLQRWFDSECEFEVRFAVVMAMTYFLNEEWLDRVFQRIDRLDLCRIRSRYRSVKSRPAVAQEGTVQGAEPYYVRMGVAWLLATALAKHPNRTRAYVRSTHLPADVIKLYVRKSRESLKTRFVEPF